MCTLCGLFWHEAVGLIFSCCHANTLTPKYIHIYGYTYCMYFVGSVGSVHIAGLLLRARSAYGSLSIARLCSLRLYIVCPYFPRFRPRPIPWLSNEHQADAHWLSGCYDPSVSLWSRLSLHSSASRVETGSALSSDNQLIYQKRTLRKYPSMSKSGNYDDKRGNMMSDRDMRRLKTRAAWW